MDVNKARIARILDVNRNRRQAMTLLLHCNGMLRSDLQATLRGYQRTVRSMNLRGFSCKNSVVLSESAVSTAPKPQPR